MDFIRKVIVLSLFVVFLTITSIKGEGLVSTLAQSTNSSAVNGSRPEDCVWRRGGDRDPCPDPLILYTLYTPRTKKKGKIAEKVNMSHLNWVRESRHDPNKETVVLIHGYAGISDVLPMGVLRDAYLKNGEYNVYVVDWSPLARIPCYPAAVHNLKPVAKCVAGFLTFLRDSGVQLTKTTCVGHSLGAHVCGIAANYLYFRMHRIIGLDPARPLIRNQLRSRLDAGDAKVVQVVHTSSTYGDSRRAGHVDFCVNGGRTQPFCVNTTNPSLCSHIRSVCYLAESLDSSRARVGEPCIRRCLTGERPRPGWDRQANPVVLGQHAPDGAQGVYCISNDDEPYCLSKDNPKGSPLCCVPPKINEKSEDL